MNRIAVILLTVLFGGCYTELQLANKETTANPPSVPPQQIVIIERPYPSPPPCCCPAPRPSPPVYPVIVQPVEQPAPPPVVENRLRTDGSTRDDRTQADRGGRRR